MADRPFDVDAIRGQALVQLVGHRAVKVAEIGARERAELTEVEPRVSCLERIHRPADELDPLIEAVVTLRFLQRLR